MARIGVPLLIILLFSTAAHSRTESSAKPAIAILDLEAINCSPVAARIITDMLGGKIFESGMFILLERSQMNIIMKERGMTGKTCSDSVCAANMGEILSVQKMVMGSVSRMEKYRIEVRIINVSDNTVDLTISSQAGSEKDFDRALDRIVSRIKYFYSGSPGISGNFDITLSGAFLHPMGDLSHGASDGVGTRLNLEFNEPGELRLCIILSTGAFYLSSKLRSVESIYMAPLELTGGYPCYPSENLKILLSAGGGYIFSRIRYDRVEERTGGAYYYRTGCFYNPVFTMRADASILLGKRWFLVLSPVYTLIFERERLGQLLSAECGLKILF